MCLGFRVDERVVRATDVRREMKVRTKEIAAERGRPLSRHERAALKEAVIAELRARAPIRTKVAELVWNPRRDEIRLFGASKAMAQAASELLAKTFPIETEEATTQVLAARSGWKAVRAVDDTGAVPVAGAELGAEFLTHLFFRAEQGETLALNGAEVMVSIGHALRLEAPDGSGAKVNIKGEYASQSDELFSALYRGALISDARVQMDIKGMLIAGTLKASTVALDRVKVPKNPEAEHAIYTEEGERPGAEVERDRSRLESEAPALPDELPRRCPGCRGYCVSRLPRCPRDPRARVPSDGTADVGVRRRGSADAEKGGLITFPLRRAARVVDALPKGGTNAIRQPGKLVGQR